MTLIDPEDCPYYLISRASLSLTSLMKKMLADAGAGDVKPAYLGALMCLWNDDNMDQVLGKLGALCGVKLNELGRCAGLEPSSMTGLIDRMERDGLVMRESDPTDRRAHRIVLTDKGMDIRNRVLEAVTSMLEKGFAGIRPEDFETTKNVLRQILINVNKGGTKDE